jgi:hypothetical protein
MKKDAPSERDLSVGIMKKRSAKKPKSSDMFHCMSVEP